MLILLHTSKTMRPPAASSTRLQKPVLLDQAKQLATELQQLTTPELGSMMGVSTKLAQATHDLIQGWTDNPKQQRPAIDSFLGDIYSGLQVASWSNSDRDYANQTLRILSGLYGILRPLDGIYPYRLEMGYALPRTMYGNVYKYWGDHIATTLPASGPIIDLTAAEYSKVITPYLDIKRFIAPKFLTISPKTGQPTFVVVHAKIARGAFASWLIKHRISDPAKLVEFNELNYMYQPELSEEQQPVFVCKTFGGLGLSVRLK